jgi:hypothetical protein
MSVCKRCSEPFQSRRGGATVCWNCIRKEREDRLVSEAERRGYLRGLAAGRRSALDAGRRGEEDPAR